MIALPSLLTEKPANTEVISFRDESLINYFDSFPKENEVRRLLKEAFVINRPMSGVGGDGYWMHQLDGSLYIVAFDCMGHGRLASMMTRIYIAGIRIAILENKLTDPGQILDKIHVEIEKTFQDKQNLLIGCGADIAVVRYHFGSGKKYVEYAGAKMDLVTIKGNELTRIKANRRQIGFLFEVKRKYETVAIELDEKIPTKFYLYSDGITDLIGSEDDRKFMFANLKLLLEEVHQLPMAVQKGLVERNLVDWLGTNLPNDDLLMIGFQI